MSANRSDLPLVIFTLTSARSGTLYLRDLFRNNVRDCVCRHEPFFDWGNPTLFGPAIYDAYAGRLDRIRARLARKRDYIRRLRTGAYLESSHAFLKSAHVAALEFFPDMRLVHLIRDPLLVAKSEAVREERRRRAHAPFHYYKGDDGRRHFCWGLTGNEEIYRSFDSARLSLFQRYLIQWIEIENRAMDFLERHRLGARCFLLESPRDLDSASKAREMFDFFGLKTRHPQITLGGRRNASLGYATAIDPKDQREFEEILTRLPAAYLDIFRREPYTRFEWNARFRSAGIPSRPALQNAV
ncbi:MAG TPA: hypothetical protein VMR33_04290 [Candidatus Baltobacteraceae bacterium]|nr:hypothetical protein [Candidatus Baltobacteraceae bacterium]